MFPKSLLFQGFQPILVHDSRKPLERQKTNSTANLLVILLVIAINIKRQICYYNKLPISSLLLLQPDFCSKEQKNTPQAQW